MGWAAELAANRGRKDGGAVGAFKDYFDRAAAQELGAQVARVYRAFNAEQFVRRATRGLADLEFNGRVQRFSDGLREGLPDPVPRALNILKDSLPAPLPNCDAVTDGWLQWPVGQFIADHGLSDPDPAFEAMVELTQRFSSEFAVRPFVEHRPDDTFRRLRLLTEHPSPHVRRWCSEGVRTRLPWGKRLKRLEAEPAPIFDILERLKDDPERYVQKSVANNLNDLTKVHPDRVLSVTKRWLVEGPSPARRWIVKHGLRTLVKDGHSDALALLGFSGPPKVRVELDVRPKRVRIGESAGLKIVLDSLQTKYDQNIVLDYAVHFLRSRGEVSKKVFKGTTVELGPKERFVWEKRHSFRPTTVRKLYPGAHRITVQLNGVPVAEAELRLLAEPTR